MIELDIGFSTCPNDTFIFDALVHRKIHLNEIRYRPHLADVEELNRLALGLKLDITKLSYHACGYVLPHYQILDSGSALGYGNGPLLVSREPVEPAELGRLKIGIPGARTTASLLLGIAYPEAKNTAVFLFSNMEEAILSGKIDAGVLIHETRFTYAERGLHLVQDLGQWWEQETALPVPLGGIVVKRDLPAHIRMQVQADIRRSLQFALDHPDSPVNYMLQHAQDMRPDILKKHVQTFVNDFSLSLGESGRQAVIALLERGSRAGLFPAFSGEFFV